MKFILLFIYLFNYYSFGQKEKATFLPENHFHDEYQYIVAQSPQYDNGLRSIDLTLELSLKPLGNGFPKSGPILFSDLGRMNIVKLILKKIIHIFLLIPLIHSP
ncbi:MAG: hypothetical protein JXB24_03015 [Bacteroidales bacterium]|nr:hypothetical protein [Bacteroidales bacterium]